MIGRRLECERLKLTEIERDLAAMRSRLEKLDGMRERLFAEMAAAIDSCGASRRGAPAGGDSYRGNGPASNCG